jgi:hypothetical protein
MISRRVLLQWTISGFSGLAAGASLEASAEPLPAGLPEEFLKRASALNYDIAELWAAFSQVKACCRSRDLADLWRVSTVPLLVIDQGKRSEVKSLDQLRGLDRIVFAAKISEAVARCRFAALFLNSDGAMIGDGELWIKEVCEDAECKKSRFLVSTIDLFD